MSELFTVFGSDGFVGRRLVARLTDFGHHVQTVGRSEDFQTKYSTLGHVMYCAGVTGSRFKTEQFRVVKAHVSLMAQVLESGIFTTFLYMSSARTYEETLNGTTVGASFRVDPRQISDFYNLSKLMGESLVLNSGISGARVVRVAYAVDYAEDSTDNVTNFIRSARQGHVRFTAHRDSVKDYVVMKDIVEMLPSVALHGSSKIYNLAGGMNTSTNELAQMLIEETGCDVQFADEEELRSPHPIDISLLESEFSYSPQSVVDYARQVIRSEKH
jgi:nucleoside-diphosphate-sugar epimerase